MVLDNSIRIKKYKGNSRLLCEFKLDDVLIKALIDTGAGRNFFCTSLGLDVDNKNYNKVVSATGHFKMAYAILPFGVKNFDFRFEGFYAFNLEHLKVNAILGMPFLKKNGMDLLISNYSSSKITPINFSTVD